MGWHLFCNQEMASSILVWSTGYKTKYARIAQLGWVTALQAEGREFDPLNQHQKFVYSFQK